MKHLITVAIAGIALLFVVHATHAADAPATQPAAAGLQSHLIRGTVEEVHPFKLKEVAEPQLLAKIKTADGDRVVANLGSANTLVAGRLERGMRVGLIGQPGSINGKTVFFAQRVEFAPAAPTTSTTSTSTAK